MKAPSDRRRRLSMRRLMGWVAILAIALAVMRVPLRFFQDQARFRARYIVGNSLIQGYSAHVPATIASPASWQEAVTNVQIAWANVVFTKDSVPEAELRGIVEELQQLASRASPASAEGDLYRILDLLGHARSRASPHYVWGRRYAVKRSLRAEGVPSPDLVAYALGAIGSPPGPPLPHLAAASGRAEDWRDRAAACRALAQLDPLDDPPAVAALIRALSDPDALVREIAAEALGDLGPRARSAGPAVMDAVRNDRGVRVRWVALVVLPGLAADPLAVERTILAALDDRDEQIREEAMRQLGALQPRSDAVLQAVLAALAGPDQGQACVAISTLEKVGPPPEVAVAALTSALESGGVGPSGLCRYQVVAAIGRLGPAAASAVPALLEELSGGDIGVRRETATALAAVCPEFPTVAAALMSAAHDDHEAVRSAAARAIGTYGPKAAAAVPSLLSLVEGDDPHVKPHAIESLGKIAPEGPEAIPALIRALRDDHGLTRDAAARSLGAFGPLARSAIPALRAIRDAPAGVRDTESASAAREALARIEGTP